MSNDKPDSYGYVCFYGNKRVEIHAGSAYEATLLTLAELKVPAKQSHMVSVILAEKNGKPVYHKGDEL